MDWNRQTIPLQRAREYAKANGPGIAGSAFLHALGIFLILFFLTKTGSQQQQTIAPFLPVDIVKLGDETAAPPALQKTAIPQQQATHIPIPQSATPRRPTSVAPSGKVQPEDSVEAKLLGLAKLHQPDAALSLDNSEDAHVDSTSRDAVAGDEATYSLRDYIRAQAERRWSLDYGMVGKREFRIAIHIQMKRNGMVTLAEIVDQQRYKTDAVYRQVALSARNAIILSSPFALPEGHYRETMDMVLMLNPKDTLH
jgi:hypothetical protein